MKSKMIIGVLVLMFPVWFLWGRAQTVSSPSWAQATMGTTCHITVSGSVPKQKLAELREKTAEVLAEVNRQMSIWDQHSEISRFNRHASTDPFPVSPGFARVVKLALFFSEATDGAFDPTVKPLVDHWGFGPENNAEPPEQLMQAVGWRKVSLNGNGLIKANPALQLDLAAIAKGYGVDCVAEALRKKGNSDFIVEIGGEIVAAGVNPSGKLWRVGIEAPNPDKDFGEEIFRTVEMSGRAMATSGDYRNFQLRDDGTRYSHIIDPHTGKPAESDVASVTVVADRCADADALATALCVMGSERGMLWLTEHPEFQAAFILHAPDGSFVSKATPNFP